jgi:transaldolase
MSSDCPQSCFEQFLEGHSAAEVWWDGHPSIYESWGALDAAREQFRPGGFNSVIRGVTTNPSLLCKAIVAFPDEWATRVRASAAEHSTTSIRTLRRLLIREAAVDAANTMRTVFDATGGRAGWVSVQLEPELVTDVEGLVRQGRWLAEAAPNIMVKVPLSGAGVAALEELTALGISTNCTMSFVASQARAALCSLERGLERRTDDRPWRSVITFMAARFGDEPELRQQAEARGITLQPGDVRWAELLNAAVQLDLIESSLAPSQLLVCSLRTDSTESGIDGSFSAHLQHITGHPVVLTCPPSFLADAQSAGRGQTWTPGALRPPADVQDRLAAIPWVRAGIDPTALDPAEFEHLPCFQRNHLQQLQAVRTLDDFARRSLAGDAQ